MSSNPTNANNNTGYLEDYGNSSLVSRMNQLIPDINTASYRDRDFGGGIADDYLAKWRQQEDQTIQDKRARSMLENELQSTKLMITTLSAKFELLQEQYRNETSNVRDMSRTISHKEKESRDAIEILSRKLEQESKRVHMLVEELARSRQNDASSNHQQQDQIKLMQEKIDNLTNRLEGYAEKSNQVGFTLNSTANQLLVESRRNEDTIKTIKMHDLAITSLSSNLDNNMDNFTRKIQMAAQDLFQRIDTEAKARKGLEDGIRQDAVEFRRMIERHIAERVDSIHSYTVAQGEHDRQEIETMANSFNAKLQRLEAATSGSQEQFASLLNQRLQLMETSILDSEQSNKRLEARIQASLAESLQFFENLLSKKDSETDKRIKEVTKSVLAMQKAIHESIQITEKAMESKLKALEEVLRAEISARLDTDLKVTSLTQETKAAFESQQAQFTKVNEQIEEAKADQSKTLTLVKSVAQQLTRSQERWVANFEGEIAKVSDSVNKQATQFFSNLNQTKTQMLQVHDDFVAEVQENHAQVVLDLEEGKAEADKIKLVLGTMDSRIADMGAEFEQKIIARSVQFDSTLEAFKIELSSRPTHASIEDRITELENEQEEERKSLAERISAVKQDMADLVSKEQVEHVREDMEKMKQGFEERCIDTDAKVKEAVDQLQLFRNEEHVQLQEDLAAQLETLTTKHGEMEDVLSKQVASYEEFKVSTIAKLDSATETLFGLDAKLGTANESVKEAEEKLKEFKQDQELAAQQASARDEKLAALKEDLTELNEEWSRKLLDAIDKQQKSSTGTSAEIKRLNDALFVAKTNTDKTVEQINHLRDTNENQTKTQKQTTLDISKRLDEMLIATQTQLEANARKISQLGINLESQVLQNQNEHLMIQEDIAFTKRLLSNGAAPSNEAQQTYNASQEELLSQIKMTSVLLDETRRDVEDFAKKAQNYERSISNRFIEINESSEKQSLEYQSQVKHLSDLVSKTQEQLDEKLNENQAAVEALSKEIKSVKSEIGKIDLDYVRIQGEMGRLHREISPPENLVKPLSSKLEKLNDRIQSLEESVQVGMEPMKPKTPKDNQSQGNIYKPAPVNMKSRKSTPRTASGANLLEGTSPPRTADEPTKVPLQHTPSSVEF